MYLIAVFFTLISLVYGTVPFTWKDCSPNNMTQAIQVTSITAGPVPLIHPGPLHLSFSAKVLKSIPVFLLEFQMKKHTLFGKVDVPCVAGLGSCTDDGCSYAAGLLNSTRLTAQSIGRQVLDMVASVNSTLSCPVPVENIDVKSYTINVPDLGPIANVIGDGDYTVTVRTKVPGTGDILGCLTMEVSLKHKCTGILCGLGRR